MPQVRGTINKEIFGCAVSVAEEMAHDRDHTLHLRDDSGADRSAVGSSANRYLYRCQIYIADEA